MSIDQDFLSNVIKRFNSYKELGDKTLDQLKEDDLFFRPSPDSNSIAIIIQHMHGNMLSRWTNFLTEDGEKDWRKRDEEFEEQTATRDGISTNWEAGWKCLYNALENMRPEDLGRTIHIRQEPLLAYDAILRQLAHYSYHVGQIITIARMIKDADWKSLSIPKHHSDAFNEQMKKQH